MVAGGVHLDIPVERKMGSVVHETPTCRRSGRTMVVTQRSLSVGPWALVLVMCAAASARADTAALQFRSAQGMVTLARAPQAAKRLSGPPSCWKGLPKLISANPLYFEARLGPDQSAFALVLDESKGTGKGYDLLYVDSRGDGDLSGIAPSKGARKVLGEGRVSCQFTGLKAPTGDGKQIAPWAFSARFSVEQIMLRWSRMGVFRSTTRSLRLTSTGYWEGTVELRGKPLRLAVVDADSNGVFGEPIRVPKGDRSGSGRLSSSGGDYVLIDTDGDGRYAKELAAMETLGCGRYVLLFGRYYELRISPSGQSLTLSPARAPLGRLSRAGGGRFVASFLTPRDGMLYVRSAGGGVDMPAGTYQLFGCAYTAPGPKGAVWQATGRGTWAAAPVEVAAGRTTAAKFGPPLKVTVIATTLLSGKPVGALKPGASVWLGLSITGRGGETYSAADILRDGKQLEPPAVKVVNEAGTAVFSATFRYA